jgi:DNA-binding PadR family transcriptional regulator
MGNRKHKPSRAERHVLLALLSGATNLSSYPLARAAQVRSGRALVILARLEHQGMVTGRAEENPPAYQSGPRRFYSLTPAGRAMAAGKLGLQTADRARNSIAQELQNALTGHGPSAIDQDLASAGPELVMLLEAVLAVLQEG